MIVFMISDMPGFMPDDLERLAGLVRIKNNADVAIAELIGRPSARAEIGVSRRKRAHLTAMSDIWGHQARCAPAARWVIDVRRKERPHSR
jgi:hypothetical protein